jgi:hypothetical protein
MITLPEAIVVCKLIGLSIDTEEAAALSRDFGCDVKVIEASNRRLAYERDVERGPMSRFVILEAYGAFDVSTMHEIYKRAFEMKGALVPFVAGPYMYEVTQSVAFSKDGRQTIDHAPIHVIHVPQCLSRTVAANIDDHGTTTL